MSTGGGGQRAAEAPDLSSVLLPSVVHDASAAVLIVDLDRRAVTFANDLARQLAPGATLPMPVDEWSAAAGLEDVTGVELPEGAAASVTEGPRPAESLLRVAAGEPVTGEAVTARRRTVATDPRETLWVLGLPLEGAPHPMSSMALVVFLPARNAELLAGVQQAAVTTRERAVLATRTSFTITDPHQPDNPLVWVNPAFTATTGYSFDDAVGRNCRFLQGPDTDRDIVAAIREALVEEQSVTTTLLNYRADGTPFWNELSISPVRDETGRLTHFVGVQADVTARVRAQRARDEALSQVAHAAERLALLADFTARMVMGQRPDQVVDTVCSVLTPEVASLTVLALFDEFGRVRRPHVSFDPARVTPQIQKHLDELQDRLAADIVDEGPIWQVLRGDRREAVIPDLSDIHGETADSLRALLTDGLGMHTMLVVPLVARHGILGVAVLLNEQDRPELGGDELTLVRDLCVRAGLMLENTQLYARERAAAATLQRSLLPRLPRIPGIEIAASYVPADDDAAVGGDWYDVFPLREQQGESRGVGLAVGDVMGHNYDSAARMGKLSTIVRSYAWPGSDPFTVLTAVDELLEGNQLDYMATCIYGKLALHGHGATLEYSNAGHPAALVRRPGGTVTMLDDARGPMIGISAMLPAGAERPRDAQLDLAPGSTLILFTDGLTDAFGESPDLDVGLAEIARVAGGLPPDASPWTIVDALTSAAVRHSDDVAVVAIRIL